MHKTIVLSTALLVLIVAPALAGDDKPAKVKGFGGVCSACDLSKKDLSDAKMIGANFPRSNFAGADLTDAQIKGSNFSRANFRRADLSDVRARSSNFSWADLSGATLDDFEGQGINLSHATMNGTRGRDVVFSASNFSHTKILGASFIEADFQDCNFSNSDFSGSKLREAHFTNSNFTDTKFGASDLREASFDHVNFLNADFGSAIVKDVQFNEAYLVGADLSKVRGLAKNQLEHSCGNSETKTPRGIALPDCDTIAWADDFNGNNRNRSRNFSIHVNSQHLNEKDMEKFHQKTKAAILGGHEAMVAAGQALIEALEETDQHGFSFEWDDADIRKATRQTHRTQRALERSIHSLEALELTSTAAQREIEQAIASLTKAQNVLKQQVEELEGE